MAQHTRMDGLLNRSQTRRELLRTMAAAAGLASVGTFLAACNGGGDDNGGGDTGGDGEETPEETAEEEATPETTPEETAEEDDATAEATPDETAEGDATAEATPEATATEDGAAADGGGGEEHVVEMTPQNVFDPEELTISVGDTVTWRTVGAVPHTSTCDEDEASNPEEHVQRPEGAEPWNSGTVNEGEEFSHTFEVAGEYTYFCIPHEAVGMIGYITVEEA